jgi:hypothetical protein
MDWCGHRTLTDPILIVEILLPSSAAAIWTNIWAYTSIPTVREIQILHTVSIAVDLPRRAPDGNWPEVPDHLVAGDLALQSIALTAPWPRSTSRLTSRARHDKRCTAKGSISFRAGLDSRKRLYRSYGYAPTAE